MHNKKTYFSFCATQKIGGGYYKFSLNGSEGLNKIFGVSMLENLLAAKLKEISFR